MAVDKLVDSSQLNSDLTSVANAIRTKGGTSASLAFPSGFVSAIGDIPTGGGGNIVTGTFTPTSAEKGTAKSITVPYSGAGYPVALLIYPTVGAYKSGTSIYTSAQYRAIVTTMAIKCDISTTPDYTNNAIQNQAYVISTYKGSSSDSTIYSVTMSTHYNFMYRYPAEGTSGTSVARFYNSGTNLTVYIASDNGSEYGFLAGTEYTYQIVYSS